MTRELATSFADTQDLLAFNRARRAGKTTREALEVGDNGVGAWGHSTVKGTGPCVALAPTVAGFRALRLCRVFLGDRAVDCDVRDIAPEGRIDLNPDACEELGLKPPVKVMVDWTWL
jgi:hypothetical protein